MKETSNLNNLIRALNKTEKAYFKKYASRHVMGGKNKYVLLFDEISRSKNGYDENEIKMKFRNEKFVKNFPVMKKYLYDLILKSLNSFYAGSENEIKNKLRNIEILYNKGLFAACAKILNTSFKKAYRTDNFLLILELLRWKKNLIFENVYEGNEFINLENANKEEQEVISKLKNLSEFRLLSYRVQSLAKRTNPYFTGEEVIAELKNIKNNILLQNKKPDKSFPAMVTYYHTLSLLHESLAENNDAIECRKKLIRFFEDNPEKLKDNIANYIITIFNLLGPFLFTGNYEELKYYINKLRTVEKTYPGKISENDKLIIFLGSSIFELRMHINTGEFSSSEQNINEIENELGKFSGKIVRNDVLHCYYLLGYANFGAGKFEEALDWINKILNDRELNKDSRLFVKSNIIHLVIHYELGNFELIEYLIKSTYRYLRKSSFSGNDERVIIEFLKRLPGIPSRSQLPQFFEEFLRKLKLYKKNISEKNNEVNTVNLFEIQNSFTDSAGFDLESWLESKISGKSLEEIIKHKYFKS